MALDLETSRLIDTGAQQLADEQRQKALEGYDNAVRNSDVTQKGPSPDIYDYESAFAEGAEFKTAEQGGSNLPNKHIFTIVIGGREAKTGDRVFPMVDPDGLGTQAAEGIGNSWTNTEGGSPVEDYDPLIYSTLHHMQNGGRRADYDAPPDSEAVSRSFDVAESIATIRGIERQLAAMPAYEPPAEQPVDGEPVEEEEVTFDSLLADPGFQEDAAILAEYHDDEFDTPEELTEAAIQELAMLNWSTFKMSEALYAVESGDMPQEVRNAYLRMLDKYDKLSNVQSDVLLGATVGAITDPGVWLLGGISGVGMKLFAKTGAMALLKSKLAQAAVQGAGIGAIEGGAEAGLQELSLQALEGEYDTGGVLTAAGFGVLVGGFFGGNLGMLLSEPGRAGIRRAYRHVANNWADMQLTTPGSPQAQRGSFSGQPIKNPDVDPKSVVNPRDFGVSMADSGSTEYYSRLAVGIDKNWGNNFGSRSASPSQLNQLLTGWQKRGEFSGYELENTGLRYWLEEKAAAGDRITRTELQDFLWANRPRVNALISSVTDYSGEATASYKNPFFMDASMDFFRRNYGMRAIRDRFIQIEEVPVETGLEDLQELGDIYVRKVHRYVRDMAAYQDARTRGDLFPEDVPAEPAIPMVPGAIRKHFPEYAEELHAYGANAARILDQGLDVEMTAPASPKAVAYEFEVRDLYNGKTERHPTRNLADAYASDMAYATASKLTPDQLAALIRTHDGQAITAPPAFGGETQWGFLTITGGEYRNNYREMRLFLPYDSVRNVENVATERFGKPFADLSDTEKLRSERIVEMAERPAKVFREDVHYPLEANRLTHVRMQDLYAPDGTKVLAVNEMQSDMAKTRMKPHPRDKSGAAMRQKEIDDLRSQALTYGADTGFGPDVVGRILDQAEDAYYDFDYIREVTADIYGEGTEDFWRTVQEYGDAYVADNALDMTPKMDWQPREAHEIMSLNRLLQYASANGYKAIAFPNTKEMIYRIEGWSPEYKGEGLVEFYQKKIPNLMRDKRLIKRWGLDKRGAISLKVQSEPQGGEMYETMNIFTIDPKKAEKGPKAIYGIGAVATTAGSQMLEPGEDVETQ